jgi:proline iminopeptidase
MLSIQEQSFRKTEEKMMDTQIYRDEIFSTTQGHGRPMLLMHGGPGLDHTYLRPWLDPLGDHAQLIYYDQGGNGRSNRPQSYEGISFDTLADEADALRASLGYERIILFGHSFGGSLALWYALRYSKHLDGLIVCDSVPVLDYPINSANAGTPEQLQAAARGMSDPAALSEDHLWRQAWMTVLPLYFHSYDPQRGAAMDEAMHYSAKAFVHGNTRLLPTFNVLHQLGNIKVPTLVMAGRYDWITPPTPGAERIHAALPDSKLVIFEQSGHFPFIEEQETFIATVSAWIASLR